jgi:hypothetical protein
MTAEITKALTVLLDRLKLFARPSRQATQKDFDSFNFRSPDENSSVPEIMPMRLTPPRPSHIPPPSASTVAACNTALAVLMTLARPFRKMEGWTEEDANALGDAICCVRERFLEAILVAWDEGMQVF